MLRLRERARLSRDASATQAPATASPALQMVRVRNIAVSHVVADPMQRSELAQVRVLAGGFARMASMRCPWLRRAHAAAAGCVLRLLDVGACLPPFSPKAPMRWPWVARYWQVGVDKFSAAIVLCDERCVDPGR